MVRFGGHLRKGSYDVDHGGHEDETDAAELHEEFNAGAVRLVLDGSKQRYGSPRVHEDLLEQDMRVSRKRVIRLMQEEGLKARIRKRFKCTTMSDHD